jgi:hypothetical protein
MQTLTNIAKIVGSYKFLQVEYNLKQLYIGSNLFYSVDFVNILTNYFLNKVLTDSESSKLKAMDKTKIEPSVFKLVSKKKSVLKD